VDGEEITQATSVVLGPKPELANGWVDDFELYGDDTALRAEYMQYQANELSLVTVDEGPVGAGEQAMRLDYSFANQDYTGVGRQISGDWSGFDALQAWIDPDTSGNRLVLQLVADGVSFEAYPSLAGDEPYVTTIPFADWRPATWDTDNADRRLNPETLTQVSQFNIYVNHADEGAVDGGIVVDELRAVAEREEPTDGPTEDPTPDDPGSGEPTEDPVTEDPSAEDPTAEDTTESSTDEHEESADAGPQQDDLAATGTDPGAVLAAAAGLLLAGALIVLVVRRRRHS